VVPLDWHNPDNGQVITLAVRIHRADPGLSKGMLLANPGGPGGAGTYLADMLPALIPDGVGNQYDVVGWDPRGVGQSSPALRCNSRYFGTNRPSFVPKTHRLMRFWKTKTRRYAARCGASAAQALLPHMATWDNVQDMEAIRTAIAANGNPGGIYDKLNFYGFSYGTYLGQVYATQYPGQVGRFVFDGVVDPTNYWYGANLRQERGFDRNINIFFKWIARHPRAYHLGRDWRAIRRGYYRLLASLDRRPAYHGKLGPDELTDAMLGAGYYVFGWDQTATAYSQLVRSRRGAAMFRLYRQSSMGDDNGYAVYLAVQCTDAPAPAWRRQVRDARRIHRRHPFLAWDNTWYNAPCRTWPAPAQARFPVSGADLAALGTKLLLINETKDAATPYSGALRVRSLFPTASLVAGVGGITHAGSLSGVACVDNTIRDFLARGVVPTRVAGTTADRSCPKVPVPYGRYARTTSGGLSPALRQQLSTGRLSR
jgi:pimeloyl-ACP methyl ester carboxylesterase